VRVYVLFVTVVSICVTAADDAWAHSGGLDGYGCHNNRKTGGYHCHRGPMAGQHFGSKAEMLDQLKANEGNRKKSTPVTRK